WRPVLRVPDREISPEATDQVVLLDVGEDHGLGRRSLRAFYESGGIGEYGVVESKRRQMAVRVFVIVQGQAELPHVVGTTHTIGGLADLLHRRQEQGDEHADDGDDHQQLDQREAATASEEDGMHDLSSTERQKMRSEDRQTDPRTRFNADQS